jgi:hypothetical protein
LLAGQRFDEELAKALAASEVLIAVIGPRWMELLKAKIASGDRDHMREEVAGALQRKVIVVPLRVGRVDQLPPMPRVADLPEDIRELVLYQKHDLTFEHFGRDIAELGDAISNVRRSKPQHATASRVGWSRTKRVALGLIAATAISVLAIVIGLQIQAEQRRKAEEIAKVESERGMKRQGDAETQQRLADEAAAAEKAKQDQQRLADEAAAAEKAKQDQQRLADEAAAAEKAKQDQQRLANEAAAADAEKRRKEKAWEDALREAAARSQAFEEEQKRRKAEEAAQAAQTQAEEEARAKAAVDAQARRDVAAEPSTTYYDDKTIECFGRLGSPGFDFAAFEKCVARAGGAGQPAPRSSRRRK